VARPDWRALYFLGILPALLVLWVRLGIKESPRYERVTALLKEGLKKRLDIFAPDVTRRDLVDFVGQKVG
jgi:hypothetical protein